MFIPDPDVDLRHLFTGRLSWRRFAVILDHLPIESAYKTALRNDTDLSSLPDPQPGVFGPWPQHDVLLAELVDLAHGWLWANTDPDKRPARPPRYPRPGVEMGNVHAISEEALAYLEFVREHHGEHPPDGWKPALA